MVLCKGVVSSPLGEIVAVTRKELVCALCFADGWPELRGRLTRRFGTMTLREEPAPAALARAVGRYFAGRIEALAALRIDPGGTVFQRAVWEALRAVPPGEVVLYAELAARVARPRSLRAVSHASAENPILLAIPCHRVTAARDRVRGAGRDGARRAWLVDHERRWARRAARVPGA
jgi:methylated-DNA-[protein]-cysteine S-methyltransferase